MDEDSGQLAEAVSGTDAESALPGLDEEEEAADQWVQGLSDGDDEDEDGDEEGSEDSDDSEGEVDPSDAAADRRRSLAAAGQEREQDPVALSLRARMLQEALGATAENASEVSEPVAAEVEAAPDKALILPLFALLSPAQQARVFAPPPPGIVGLTVCLFYPPYRPFSPSQSFS